jgi:hypothetical protein
MALPVILLHFLRIMPITFYFLDLNNLSLAPSPRTGLLSNIIAIAIVSTIGVID